MPVASKDVLMSMKRRAFFGRVKGRDLFDLVYLVGMGVRPHRGYMKDLVGIADGEQLRTAIVDRLSVFNLAELASDVAPFLFDPRNQSVLLFPQIMAQTQW